MEWYPVGHLDDPFKIIIVYVMRSIESKKATWLEMQARFEPSIVLGLALA